MARINREEYEKIKSLPDYDWNWIAREKTGKILSFANKPTKTDEVWKDKQTRLWLNHKDSQLFQFIQWEDEEPYNIQELIDEYESEYHIENAKIVKLDASKLVARDASDYKHFYKRLGESEETEVKNIKWANEEIKKEWNLLNDKRYEREVDDLTTGVLLGLKKALNILDQLDEPEVLSQKWIDENTVYADVKGSTEAFLNIDSVKNLLVPKQEEVDQAYKDGYEKGKQHTFYKGYLEGITDKGSEPETVADVVTTFWKSYERLKEVMNMEVEESSQ